MSREQIWPPVRKLHSPDHISAEVSLLTTIQEANEQRLKETGIAKLALQYVLEDEAARLEVEPKLAGNIFLIGHSTDDVHSLAAWYANPFVDRPRVPSLRLHATRLDNEGHAYDVTHEMPLLERIGDEERPARMFGEAGVAVVQAMLDGLETARENSALAHLSADATRITNPNV